MTLVTVTQADIDAGTKDDSTCCPVALACARAGIPSYIARKRIDDLRVPEHVSEFIQDFDRDETVLPLEFEMIPYFIPEYDD